MARRGLVRNFDISALKLALDQMVDDMDDMLHRCWSCK
jgi:hypothetical protein